MGSGSSGSRWGLRGLSVIVIAVLIAGLVMAGVPTSQYYLGEASDLQLEKFYTRVYGLIGFYTPNGLSINDAELSSSLGTLVVAGVTSDQSPMVAGIDVSTMELAWSQAMVGEPVDVEIDSSNGEWVAVATTAGEIVLINIEDPGIRADFYTASRAEVSSLALSTYGGAPVIAAVDLEGSAYIANPSLPGWIEFSPLGNRGMLEGYVSPPIALVIAEEVLAREGGWFIGPRAFLTLAAVQTGSTVSASGDGYYDDLDARVRATLFFETEAGAVIPAIPTTIEDPDRGLRTVYTLYMAVAPATGKGLVIAPSSPGGGGGLSVDEVLGLAVLESEEVDVVVPASDERLIFIYTEEVYKVEEGGEASLLDFTCYSTEVYIDPSPGSENDLDIVVMGLDASSGNIYECASNLGVSLGSRPYQPILVVDLSVDQWSFEYTRDARMVWLPLPEDLSGFDGATIARLFTLATPPALDGVNSLLLVGSPAGYLHIYYLDANGNPVDWAPTPQTIYLGGPPMEVRVEPDGSRIYVGTERGHLFLLEFSPTDSRYWISRSISVAESPISSIALAQDNAILAASNDGVLQMIDLDSWTPLWRNLPGFSGVNTGLEQPEIVSPTATPAIIVSIGGTSLYTFNPVGLDLNPVEIEIRVLIESDEGVTEASPGEFGAGEARIVDSSGAVYAVDVGVLERGEILLYTPKGSYTLEVVIDGLGRLYKDIEVGGEIVEDLITVRLREVAVRAIVPEDPPVEAYRMAYELYAGPLPGVEVVLSPLSSDPALGYKPEPVEVEGITGDGGEFKALIWSGVEYSVEGSSPVVARIQGGIPFYEVGVVDVMVELLVKQVSIRALDAEASSFGVEYELPVSRLVVSRADVERTSEIIAPGPTIYLPPGEYTATVESEGYEEAVIELEVLAEVSGVQQFDVTLEPGSWRVVVDPILVDPTGRISGSLKDARVVLTLEEPSLGYAFTGTTGEEGRAEFVVRPGKYTVRVEHPALGSVEVREVKVSGDTLVNIPFEVDEATLRISLMDSELGVEAVGGFDISLTYVYTGFTYSVSIDGSVFELTLPAGLYSITIESREGYYEVYHDAGVSLSPGVSFELAAWLEPVKIPVLVEVYYRDEEGIASGGVGGALVTAVPVETPIEVPVETVQTGPDGTALLYLRPGVYNVEASHTTTKTASTSIDLLGADREGLTVRIGLEPIYGVLELVAVDSETGLELPEVFFRVVWNGYTTTTERVVKSEGGRAEILAPLGSYIVEASLPTHYRNAMAAITLVQERAVVTLNMDPITVELEIKVINRESVAIIDGRTIPFPSSPAPNAQVILEPRDPILEAQGIDPTIVFTDESGGAKLILRAGSYMATAFLGEASESQEVRVTEGTNIVILTVTPQLKDVALLAVDPDIVGEARIVEGAVLAITAYNGVELEEEVLIRSPANVVLPTGLYIVKAWAEGYVEVERVVEVNESSTVEVPLEPLRVDVSLRVEADFLGERMPVLSGSLIMSSLTLENLKPVEIEVLNGGAQASLRPGEYAVTYKVVIGGEEYTLNAGTLTVQQDVTEAGILLIPTPIAIGVAPLDEEFEVPITVFQVRFVYQGPFGTMEALLEGMKGEVLIQAPPGYFRIELSAPGYQPEVIEASAVNSLEITTRMSAVLLNASINLVDPDGRPVEGEVEVVVRHTELPIRLEKRITGPILRLEEVRPGIYIVEVTPIDRQDLIKTSARVAISPEGRVEPGVIEVAYTTYLVELRLVDASTGELVDFPHIASIERIPPEGGEELVVETIIQGSTLITLPPGTYRTTLVPEGGENYYNVDVPFTFTVTQDTVVDLRVSPIVYAITVVVIDDRGDPLAGAFVRVTTADGRDVAAGTTDINGNFTFQAPFGVYTVEATKPGYREAVGAINVPQTMLITLELEPGPQVLAMRYGPIAIGIAGLALIAGLIYRVRDRIARRIMEEEEYF
ncbi:MAG: carboxypeptidase-like regulatory domain-containing protein [Aeropyrum sp.]|nr:carboxypeptidase-like regulatory domain-containing protein [Aeropyrum sp.]